MRILNDRSRKSRTKKNDRSGIWSVVKWMGRVKTLIRGVEIVVT